MKEDQHVNDAACQAFEQHRFKGHLCVHCFKPQSAHTVNAENGLIPDSGVKTDTVDNAINMSQESRGNLTHKKNDIPKVIFRNQNNLHKDARVRGERQVERNNRKKVKERTKMSVSQGERGDAQPSIVNVLPLNIPLNPETSPILDNKLSRKGELTHAQNGSSDLCSKNAGVNANEHSCALAEEFNGNVYSTPSFQRDTESDLGGSFSQQFRGALRPVQKPGGQAKSHRREGLDSELPEFVKVAQNLRHIQSPVPVVPEILSSNNNNHSVIGGEGALTDLPDLPNVIGSDADTELQQKLVDSKSKLSPPLEHLVKNTQTMMTGHETLPKHIGKSRPCIKPLAKHQRQTSDPALLLTQEKRETTINVSLDTNKNIDYVQTENVVVRNSQLNSDVYFGKTPNQTPSKISVLEEHEVGVPRYGHISDCVTIISVSGQVSHQYSPGTPRKSSPEDGGKPSFHDTASQINPSEVAKLTVPNPLEIRTDPSSAVQQETMPPTKRMSQEVDEGLELAQQEETFIRSKDLAPFSRRNVALVDGIYTPVPFTTDSGINDSMESSDSSDGPKAESAAIEQTKRNTPPYPIILHEEQQREVRNKKRNSGQYKVPIFILPKKYESNSEWNSANHNITSDSATSITPSSDLNVDYLQPKEKTDGSKNTVLPTPMAAEGDDSHHKILNCKKVSVSNKNLAESCRPSRSRSKTHPVVEEDVCNVKCKHDQEHLDFIRHRLKRAAPRPPSMELTDERISRERDDRLDSLPHRSPPPPPLSKRDSKRSLDRSSSDLSDDVDRSPRPHTLSDDATMAEIDITMPTGNSHPLRRDMSPSKQNDASPDRSKAHPRKQHESRNAMPAKKEGNFKVKLREFSPTGRRELSPAERGNKREVTNKETPHNYHQPVRRVTSPPPPLNRPPPLNLPNTTATQDPLTVITKSKKSKLPWKWKRKREDSGSPEREFNSEEVEKWLKDSFPPSASPPLDPSQRNSLERLEVINAYKGEPTVAIERKPSTTMTTPLAIPATAATTSIKRGSAVEEEDALTRNAVNSISKRRAPMPPVNHDQENVGPTAETVLFQKSYSLSPTSRRRIASERTDVHMYENLGPNRAKLAPQKPARRRQRNRTTAFEDMPSRVKRMAPKTPDSAHWHGVDGVEGKGPEESGANGGEPFGDVPHSSSPPLKSALRSTVSEPSKAIGDGKAAPKRPVRIVAPEDEEIVTEPAYPTVLRSDYKNLALVPQAELDNTIRRDAETQTDAEHCRKFVADAQCSAVPDERGRFGESCCRSLLLDVSGMHVEALAQLGRLWPQGLTDSRSDEMMSPVWKEQISSQSEPDCCSAGAAFFSVTAPTHSSHLGLMVCCSPAKTESVLHIAEITKAMSPHPNLLPVSHATRDGIDIDHSLLDQRRSRGSPTADGSIETALVITDSCPAMNVACYVAESAEKHRCLPEVYERDVALMVLQLCRGLCELQSHHMCLESLKLGHLLLLGGGPDSGGQRLVINHVMGAERVPQASGSGIVSKLEQRCHEFDVGILIYEFLHQPSPFSTRTSLIISDYTEQDLPGIPVKSKFSAGLHALACQLLAKKPENRLTCSQAVSLLQCLIWGPPASILCDNGGTPEAPDQAVERWLATERSNTICKIALHALPIKASPDRNGLSLADQLQCQYLADTTAERCKDAMSILYAKREGQAVGCIQSDLDL